MKLLYLLNIFLLLMHGSSESQTTKLSCIEKEQKNGEGQDPILVKTCVIKNFKFVSKSFPDYAGRYVYSEHQVYVLKNNKYVKTTNSKVFNRSQDKLVTTINNRILEDFHQFSTDSNTKECLRGTDSIPTYKMDDFEISFEGNEIWFEVHWGLSSACRNVDGTIVSFKLEEIKKYLN